MGRSPAQIADRSAFDVRVEALLLDGASYSVAATALKCTKSRVHMAAQRLGRASKRPEVRALIYADGGDPSVTAIDLGAGRVSLVDTADAALVSPYNWYTNNNGYACRSAGRRKVLLHHAIVGRPPAGCVVDHVDGDKLNNRRANLRFCTPQQNSQNMAARPSRQPYKGVGPVPGSPHVWRARIRAQGKLQELGHYADARSAAIAYDRAARKFFGEYARPNFEVEPSDEPVAYVAKVARGEAVCGAKLTAEKVREFRRANSQGVSVYRLAKDHGLSFRTVRLAVSGRTWAHVGASE